MNKIKNKDDFPVNCYTFFRVWFISPQKTMIFMYVHSQTVPESAIEDGGMKNKI